MRLSGIRKGRPVALFWRLCLQKARSVSLAERGRADGGRRSQRTRRQRRGRRQTISDGHLLPFGHLFLVWTGVIKDAAYHASIKAKLSPDEITRGTDRAISQNASYCPFAWGPGGTVKMRP